MTRKFLFALIVSFSALLASCTKDSPVVPTTDQVQVVTVQDRTLILDLDASLTSSNAVSFIQIGTNVSSIASGTRLDVYACAPQSSEYPEPTTGYQLISQHGPGSLSNQSIYPSSATYNSVFSTPYAPAEYYVWFKVQEYDTSGDGDVLVESTTFAGELKS